MSYRREVLIPYMKSLVDNARYETGKCDICDIPIGLKEYRVVHFLDNVGDDDKQVVCENCDSPHEKRVK